MRTTELLRLVWLNINQNKFKTVMTSIGIVVGAATIVMVIAIGRGGQMDVAEQYSSLNAGAIDISYDWEGTETGASGSFSLGSVGEMFKNGISGMFGGGTGGASDGAGGGQSGMNGGFGGGMEQRSGNAENGEGQVPNNAEGGGNRMEGGGTGGDRQMPDDADGGEQMRENAGDERQMPEDAGGDRQMPDGADAGGQMQENAGDETGSGKGGGEENVDSISEEPDGSEDGTDEEDSIVSERMNQEQIILTEDDVEDIRLFMTGISGVTISYTAKTTVEGGNLTESQTYTVAGVKEEYLSVSNLAMAEGEFLTDADDLNKARVCVLGAVVAKELFGSVEAAYEGALYLADRAYTVVGVLDSSGTVSAGITPDESIFVPYNTGIKYITGESISPVITVIADDVNAINSVKADLEILLAENYSNAEFTFADAGSKLEAAESSNQILTMLLTAMAAIVFLVGGIGIMNVLFVSVKERTPEIGILKSMGASRSTILFEFLIESAAISLIGGILGVAASFAVTPIVEYYEIRVEANAAAWLAALGFAVLTGTLFGFYPAWKASRLVPVDALNAE